MLELLQYSFMQKAMMGALFTVVICAVVGVLVVVNRTVYLTGGISHASYGGIGLALFVGIPPVFGAIGLAAGAGLILGIIRQRNAAKADAVVSGLWAAGMALGIILNDITPGYSIDFLSYLFGDILLLTNIDLVVAGSIAALSLLLILKYYKMILIVVADQEYAVTLGINVKIINLIMLVFICTSVVALMKTSGLILVMALLSMPASIAETRAKKLSSMMILSGIISAIAIFSGIFISALVNITPSAVIIIVLTLIYIINMVLTFKNK